MCILTYTIRYTYVVFSMYFYVHGDARTFNRFFGTDFLFLNTVFLLIT